MKEQLLLLLRLQEIDSRVQELRVAMSALPEKLDADKQNLAKLEAMLAEEKARYAETDAWRQEQERLIALEEQAIRKAKSKLQAAKGGKDYTAANRELDNKRRNKSDREEEVLKVMGALETFRTDIAAHEQEVSKLREHVAAEGEKVATQVAQLEVEITEGAAGRDDLTAQIAASTLKRYERTRKSRGIAVVPVLDGVCQGCHMSVPPQLNNVLARCDSIEICPRCQRILYRKELLEDSALED